MMPVLLYEGPTLMTSFNFNHPLSHSISTICTHITLGVRAPMTECRGGHIQRLTPTLRWCFLGPGAHLQETAAVARTSGSLQGADDSARCFSDFPLQTPAP